VGVGLYYHRVEQQPCGVSKRGSVPVAIASISFLSGFLEYFQLEGTVVCMNRSIKEITYLLNW
jgi:hypothetical protein